MKLIEGNKIAQELRENLKQEVLNLNKEIRLGIILVGNNDASEIYVRNKLKACADLGITGLLYRFNENNTEEDIINCIKELNEDEFTYGIMVQSPVLPQFHEDYITSFIDPDKDVDGFGITSLGKLAANDESFIAATPYGIIKMLEHENISVKGKRVVIVGRSIIVGRPLALALLNRDATVTIAHSKTKDLKEVTKEADILVVAIGKANYIDNEYIKDGAVVIDVGINRIDGKLVGDVNFEKVKDKVSYITPVPGGVGPMTVTMLLNNVIESAKRREKYGSKNQRSLRK